MDEKAKVERLKEQKIKDERQSRGFGVIEGDPRNLKDSVTNAYLNSGYVAWLRKDSETNPRSAFLIFLDTVEVVSASKTSDTTAKLLLRFPVPHEYLNPGKTLQGGLQSAVFDIATSWLVGMIHRPGFWENSGTSRTLNVTFLRPAVEGEMLLIDCELVHASKRFALTTAKLMREKDRALISTCEHQKYYTGPYPML